ncbi:MAG: 30S ribosomal protein S1 [Pseudomonadota bacterium]|nr:30S ribosomal protein S1 [Pseudomonadota bacterium]
MTAQSEFESLFKNSVDKIDMTPGSIVDAKVIDIRNDYVVINAGLKSEGVINKNQFLDSEGNLEIKVGDTVEVTLDAVEDGYGETLFSREKAKRIKVWTELEKYQTSQEIIQGKVCGKVKGGFTVELMNVKAFLPGSLVDIRPTKEVDYLEGKTLDFKIIKMDKIRNNIVLSRKAVLLDQNCGPEEAAEKYVEGKTLTGFIKNLTDYGAFIDLGGIDGLLHITDISWKRISHPSEVLKVGDEIKVIVLKYDNEKNRVSLGMKQLEKDPWEQVSKKFELNKKYKGKVINVVDYGVFVDLGDNIEGLVRSPELDWTNKNINPNKVLSLGEEVEVMIIDIDDEKKRISLSYKQCKENPWLKFSENHKKNEEIKSKIKSITDFGIFVGLEGDIDGLIHIADVAAPEKQEEVIRSFKKGDEIEAVILSIDPERERVSLSLKKPKVKEKEEKKVEEDVQADA